MLKIYEILRCSQNDDKDCRDSSHSFRENKDSSATPQNDTFTVMLSLKRNIYGFFASLRMTGWSRMTKAGRIRFYVKVSE